MDFMKSFNNILNKEDEESIKRLSSRKTEDERFRSLVLPKNRRVFQSRQIVDSGNVPEYIDHTVDGTTFRFRYEFDLNGQKAVYKSLIGDWLTVAVK